MTTVLERARGCLLGQLAGDSLGGLVEFQEADRIRASYPDGVRHLAAGGTWNTLAGQPTDDSEMALALARTLVERQAYDLEAARAAYERWIASGPFDSGGTTRQGLSGFPSSTSQANGALMRVSPLGIAGWREPFEALAEWARLDASITHPHRVCKDANVLYVYALALAIRDDPGPEALYEYVLERASSLEVEASLFEALEGAREAPPAEYFHQMGWVLIAFRNAFWQLLHAPSVEEGVVDTIMRGGDTDTNAAIAGALLGAVHGLQGVPKQWVDAVCSCRPEAGRPGVRRPRPREYWPDDALQLAQRLLAAADGP